MDPLPLALVLVAAGVHAAWNLSLHRWEDAVAAMAVAGIAAGVILAPALLLAPPWEVWPLLLVSVAAQTAYGRTLPAAYARGALSFAYPVGRGSAPLLVTIGGWLLLAETPAVTGVAGAVALGTGLVMLARRARQVDQATAVGFALLTGLAIAAYQLVDAAAVRTVSPVGYLGASQLGSGLLLAALIGSLVGFLKYNWQPARIYMGDTGAMFIGLLLGAMAMIGKYPSDHPLSLLTPVFILGIPIFDTLFVMWIRYQRRLPIFWGSPDHIAIRLRHWGMPVPHIVLVSYAATAFVAAIGLALMMVGPDVAWTLCVSTMAVLLASMFALKKIDVRTSAASAAATPAQEGSTAA